MCQPALFPRFAASLFLFSLASLADTVRLKNGDVLTGEVVGLAGSKLTLKTQAMGTVAIDLSAVASIEAMNELSVKLKDQEARVGRLAMVDGAVVLMAKDGGQMDVAPDRVERIMRLESPEQARETWRQRSTGSILFGASSASGNTDAASVFTRAEAKLSEVVAGGKPDPLSMVADYQLGEIEGEMTTRRGEGRIRYDYEFVTKTSMFYLERLSFDEFQDLDLRAEEQAGVNRRLMDRNRLGLSADAGVARVDSFYEEAEDEGDFGLILGGHAFWTIVGSLKLTQDVEYRPAFADFDRYLLSSETGLSTKLSENWQVRLLYQIHYSSQPPEDVEQTDRNLALTLGYSF